MVAMTCCYVVQALADSGALVQDAIAAHDAQAEALSMRAAQLEMVEDLSLQRAQALDEARAVEVALEVCGLTEPWSLLSGEQTPGWGARTRCGITAVGTNFGGECGTPGLGWSFPPHPAHPFGMTDTIRTWVCVSV